MSRADGADRLLSAAIALGVSHGLGAMSVQGIATAAGVSKALVLYHHSDKPTLLRAVHARLVAENTHRLRDATAGIVASDPLESWRALARAEVRSGELALLAALAQDDALRMQQSASRATPDEERTAAAGEFARAILSALAIPPRVGRHLLGALLVRQLDGLVIAHGRHAAGRDATHPDANLDAELDAFALALLGLGP
jgi:AcrR family transcriptional regulator